MTADTLNISVTSPAIDLDSDGTNEADEVEKIITIPLRDAKTATNIQFDGIPSDVRYGDTFTITATLTNTAANPNWTFQVRDESGFNNNKLAEVTPISNETNKFNVKVLSTKTFDINFSYEDDQYYKNQHTDQISVKQRDLTVGNLQLENRSYDGSLNVDFVNNGQGATINGLVAPDQLTLNFASALATMLDPNAGSQKNVMIVGIALNGHANTIANYNLIQPTGLKVDISNAEQAAPDSGLFTAHKPSAQNAQDASISGTTTAMEYSTDSDFSVPSNIKPCTNAGITGISAGTYYIRYKAKTNYNASQPTTVVVLNFNPTPVEKPASVSFTYDGQLKTAFTVDSAAGYTLVTEDGFTNTATNAGNYKVKFRLKQNYQWKGGSTDDAVVNWTIQKAAQAAIAAPELSFSKNADNKTFTATIKKVNGAQYSFDGTNYSDTNTKSDCQPDTNITAYIRKKADANHEAGTASNTTKKTPAISSNSGNSGSSNSSNNSSNSGSSNNSGTTGNVISNRTLVSSQKQQKETLNALTKNAKSGETLSLKLDDKAKLFAKSLEQVAGKNVTIQLQTGKVTWEIDAKNLPKNAELKDLDLGVKLNSNSIPQTAIEESFGEQKPIQMEIAHDGEFGFTMNLNVNVGVKNHNLFANVYYYNPITKKNEFKSAHKIDKKGNISIPFDHASSYAILVDKVAHSAKEEMKPNESKQVYENKFEDVKTSDWFYDAVAYMAQNKFMSGVSQTSFAPDTSTSRAMIVAILHRAAGAPKAMSTHSFKDIPMGAYYEEALSWASENKIVSGYNEDSFAPNDAITREQFALILMNFAKSRDIEIKMGTKQLTFDDADQISTWAKDALTWANTSKIINGDGMHLNPKQNATRAQAAIMIMNFMQNFFEEAVPYHN